MINSPHSVSRRGLLAAGTAAVPALLLGVAPRSAYAEDTTLVVSTLGFDPDDSTQFLQAALDSDASTVIIDLVAAGPWITDPLFLRRSNVRVIIEPGVTVQARTAGFSALGSRLLQVEHCSNVTISGYGATLRMDKSAFPTGEWRNAMRLYAVQNSTIEGLTLRDSGGDGISITGGTTTPSRDVVLRDLVCDNNRRNGIAVANAVGMEITGCAFLNSNGTPPQTGIDLEPDAANHQLTGISIRDCWIRDNVTAGMSLVTSLLTATSTPVDVTVERCTVGRQSGGSPQIMVWGSEGSGSFELVDCLIDVKPYSGAFGTLGVPPGGVMTTLNRTSIWNIGNQTSSYTSLSFSARGRPSYGNLTLSDAVLVSDQPSLFLQARDPGSTLHNVTGDITVVNPNGATVDYGPSPVNVGVAVTSVTSPASAAISLSVVTPSVTGGGTATVRFSRTGGDLTRPLAVAYTTTGTARERYDYAGLGKVVTFPSGAASVDLGIPTYQRRQASDPASRTVAVAVPPGHHYTPPSGTGSFTIID